MTLIVNIVVANLSHSRLQTKIKKTIEQAKSRYDFFDAEINKLSDKELGELDGGDDRAVYIFKSLNELTLVLKNHPQIHYKNVFVVCKENELAVCGELVSESDIERVKISIDVDVKRKLTEFLTEISLERVVDIRRIETEEDLKKYFELRYEVWSELGYLKKILVNCDSLMEMDHLDRASIPIGAFNGDELIGCVRIVKKFGNRENTKLISRINKIIRTKGDEILKEAFSLPDGLNHPFDILYEFKGFRKVYRDVVNKQPKVIFGEISRLIVKKEFRKKMGLGQLLAKCAIQESYKEQVNMLILACLEDHEEYYLKCGFEHVPQINSTQFFEIQHPSIVMWRKLEQKRKNERN